MKKILITIFSAILLLLPVTEVFSAGPGFSFDQKSLSIYSGRTYNVDVYVDSGGARTYVTQLSLDFPANLLEVKNFTYAAGWVAVSVPPYEAMDNKTGTLIKAAGWPGGFTGRIKFGTINFYAKRGGYGKLSILPESLGYNESGKNVLTDYSASLALSGSQAKVAAKPKPAPAPVVASPKPVPPPVATVPKAPEPKPLIPPVKPYIREKLAVEPLPTPAAEVVISDYEKYLREAELNKLIAENKNQTLVLQSKIAQAKNTFTLPLYAFIGSLFIIFIAVLISGLGAKRGTA